MPTEPGTSTMLLFVQDTCDVSGLSHSREWYTTSPGLSRQFERPLHSQAILGTDTKNIKLYTQVMRTLLAPHPHFRWRNGARVIALFSLTLIYQTTNKFANPTVQQSPPWTQRSRFGQYALKSQNWHWRPNSLVPHLGNELMGSNASHQSHRLSFVFKEMITKHLCWVPLPRTKPASAVTGSLNSEAVLSEILKHAETVNGRHPDEIHA